jgi:hypothetical protein
MKLSITQIQETFIVVVLVHGEQKIEDVSILKQWNLKLKNER